MIEPRFRVLQSRIWLIARPDGHDPRGQTPEP